MSEIDWANDIEYPAVAQGRRWLLQAKVLPLDLALRNHTFSFSKGSLEDQDHWRQVKSEATDWTLILFAQRAALFAIRDKEPEWLRSALLAIAMTNSTGQDYRDVLTALSRLKYSALRLNLDVHAEFDSASKLADEKTSGWILDTANRERSLSDGRWGFREVETAEGIGFVRNGGNQYQTARDLLEVGIGMADIVEADPDYATTDLIEASSWPRFWLNFSQDQEIELAKRATGCVQIRSEMEPYGKSARRNQLLLIYLMEMKTAGDAESLETHARAQSIKNTCTLTLCHDCLFTIVVARCYVTNMESVEDSTRLQRFRRPLLQVLTSSS